ncbi:hypothetical protein GCM10008967_04720 [Bacillus carboniphilus]|uniref:Uncharacterized protein n=2 Tax=Bacillus carboniphilus TaxID=86663 RepID=A0ABN0VUD4_9BACI
MIRWIRFSTTEKMDEVPGVVSVTPLKDGEQLSPDIYDFKTITGHNRSQSFLLEAEDVDLPSKIRAEDDYCFVFIFEKEDYINLDEYKISFNKKVQGIKEITITDSFDH